MHLTSIACNFLTSYGAKPWSLERALCHYVADATSVWSMIELEQREAKSRPLGGWNFSPDVGTCGVDRSCFDTLAGADRKQTK
jgi:hypothetical protein